MIQSQEPEQRISQREVSSRLQEEEEEKEKENKTVDTKAKKKTVNEYLKKEVKSNNFWL